MQLYQGHRLLFITTICLVLLLIFAMSQITYIVLTGRSVSRPDIPREAQTLGSGEPLTYVVLGDSTAVGQGGDYNQGIAIASAQLLATNHAVTFQNFAVSGAKTKDVLRDQVDQAAALAPDVVLIAVGANDVTHLTPLSSVHQSMNDIINKLHAANPRAKIILTGAPAMGTVPRFAKPTRLLATLRTNQVNTVMADIAREHSLTFAAVADKTGPTFAKNPQLFAQDKFHPNNDGYAVWAPVINEAITAAIQ
jgi:acyl-CoA thioesterase-1